MASRERKKRRKSRTFRFWIIRRIVMPLALPLLRLWIGTWRFRVERSAIAELARTSPDHPGCGACFHGQQLCMLGLFLHFPRKIRPVPAVLNSPSQDGQMMQEVCKRLGFATATGSTRGRNAAGLIEIIRHTRNGCFSVLTVDGPRGPLGVPKGGIFIMARESQAKLFAISATGSPAIRFKSWDRTFLPLPFARVTMDVKLFHDYSKGGFDGTEAPALQRMILGQMSSLGEDTSGIELVSREAEDAEDHCG